MATLRTPLFTVAARETTMKRVVRFLKSENGPTAVEYAVLLAGILLVMIAGITLVGGQTANFWSNNKSELDSAFGSGS